MKEGDEVEIPILKTPIITWRYYWCLFACRYVKAYVYESERRLL